MSKEIKYYECPTCGNRYRTMKYYFWSGELKSLTCTSCGTIERIKK